MSNMSYIHDLFFCYTNVWVLNSASSVNVPQYNDVLNPKQYFKITYVGSY